MATTWTEGKESPTMTDAELCHGGQQVVRHNPGALRGRWLPLTPLPPKTLVVRGRVPDSPPAPAG